VLDTEQLKVMVLDLEHCPVCW